MPIDQTHEQNNELVKGSGGAVGLMENPLAFNHNVVFALANHMTKAVEDIIYIITELYNNRAVFV